MKSRPVFLLVEGENQEIEPDFVVFVIPSKSQPMRVYSRFLQ